MTYSTEKNDIYSVTDKNGEISEMNVENLIDFIKSESETVLGLEFNEETRHWDITECPLHRQNQVRRDELWGSENMSEEQARDLWYAELWSGQEYLQSLINSDSMNWELKSA